MNRHPWANCCTPITNLVEIGLGCWLNYKYIYRAPSEVIIKDFSSKSKIIKSAQRCVRSSLFVFDLLNCVSLLCHKQKKKKFCVYFGSIRLKFCSFTISDELCWFRVSLLFLLLLLRVVLFLYLVYLVRQRLRNDSFELNAKLELNFNEQHYLRFRQQGIDICIQIKHETINEKKLKITEWSSD